MTALITVRNLTRKFGSFTAVDDLDLRLEAGEVVGFLGPNGAGKTTTMRMLTGFLPPTSGQIEIAGLDLLRDSLEVRSKLGYLPEAVPFYGEHRVSELCTFQGRLHGMPRALLARRSAEVLERVGLADRARSLFGKLSKGQRQRVGLALALLHDPPVLILDEPTSGLDPLQRIEVRKLIAELSAERTVLLSSHILPEIEAICPRVVILDHGRIAAQGTHAELVREHGGGSAVRLEAVVGPDVEAAARWLGAIAGVEAVEDQGRLGIHHVFRITCSEDLREDVGALAALKGWALRELSYERPTLESIFARIALGLDEDRAAPPAGTPRAPAAAGPAAELLSLAGAPSAPAAPSRAKTLDPFAPRAAPRAVTRPAAAGGMPPAAATREVYNLNPFELGPDGRPRNLSAPTTAERKKAELPYEPPRGPAAGEPSGEP